MSGERILVVDDEPRFRKALVRGLEGQGYWIKESTTAASALENFLSFQPAVVLLDLMLPDGDGVDVCHELRRDSEVAIIVLSVVGGEQMKVRALDEGADDYLTKPFGMDELLARIRAALRRSSPSISEGVFRSGPMYIDLSRRLVLLAGEEVHLTPTEFRLLQFLVSNAGRVLRHASILTNVWGDEYEQDTQILRTYINQLRAKLHDDSGRPRFIRTDPGVGYRFIHPDP